MALTNTKFVFTLSTCIHDPNNHEKKMVGPKQIEIKLDGVRVLTDPKMVK